MKYRVVIDLGFDDERDARGVFDAAKRAYPRAKPVSNREGKKINIHKCYHDETPTKSCELIEEKMDAESDGPAILT